MDCNDRSGSVQPADNRLSCNLFRTGSQREGVDTLGICGISVSVYGGCRSTRRFDFYRCCAGRVSYGDGTGPCPVSVIYTDGQLRRCIATCAGSRNRNAFRSCGCLPVSVCGADMQIPCSACLPGGNSRICFIAQHFPAIGRNGRSFCPCIFQLAGIRGCDAAGECAVAVGQLIHSNRRLGSFADRSISCIILIVRMGAIIAHIAKCMQYVLYSHLKFI